MITRAQSLAGPGSIEIANSLLNAVPAGFPEKAVRSRWNCSASVHKVLARSAEERLVADEPLFRVLLATERKRLARSGSSSLLVVLHIKDLPQNPNEMSTFAPLDRRIFSVIRETDVAGWCDAKQAGLGILFTEIAELNEAAVSTILRRVRKTVREHALLEQLIVITWHVLGNGTNSSESFGPLALAGD